MRNRNLFLAILLVTGAPMADEIDTLTARLRTDYLQSASSSNAATYLSSLRTDGSWADVDYADRSQTNWKPVEHLKRVKVLCVAYGSAGTYHNSSTVLDAISRALTYWYTRKPTSTNWWHNDIGQQLELGKILVMLRDSLAAPLVDTGCTYLNNPSMTGQNLVWLSTQTTERGCVKHLLSDVTTGLNAIKAQAVITTSEGIQPDFSFHQHGAQLYSAGYGLGFVNDVSYWAFAARGLSFGFTTQQVAALSGLLLNGDRWMVRSAMMDYSADGREISRSGQSTQATQLLTPCTRLAALDAPRSSEFDAMAAHIRGTRSDPLVGNKHFWRSDFMAHHRADFYASVKMCSRRTQGSEYGNGENIKGGWLPFGLTYICRRGNEYADIFPVWDWSGLPGVTSPATVPTLVAWASLTQQTDFVGGASNGAFGISAMHLSKDSTTARKSWFCFDRGFLALGSGITSTQSAPVFTTVNQCLLNGDVYVNGALVSTGTHPVTGPFRVFHDSVGYAVLSPSSGSVINASQTGSWASINTSQSSATVAKDVFTCRLSHGTRPTAQTYAYVVVPGISRSAFDAYAASPSMSVAANTDSVQAAYDNESHVGGAAFYVVGSVVLAPGLAVDVDQPCIVIVDQRDTTKVSVANPRNAALTVHVGITTTARQVLTFALPGGNSAGSTVTQYLPVNITTSSPRTDVRSTPGRRTGVQVRTQASPQRAVPGTDVYTTTGRLVGPKTPGPSSQSGPTVNGVSVVRPTGE